MNRYRDGMPKGIKVKANIQSPISTSILYCKKNVRMDEALYVHLQFLPSLVV